MLLNNSKSGSTDATTKTKNTFAADGLLCNTFLSKNKTQSLILDLPLPT